MSWKTYGLGMLYGRAYVVNVCPLRWLLPLGVTTRSETQIIHELEGGAVQKSGAYGVGGGVCVGCEARSLATPDGSYCRRMSLG